MGMLVTASLVLLLLMAAQAYAEEVDTVDVIQMPEWAIGYTWTTTQVKTEPTEISGTTQGATYTGTIDEVMGNTTLTVIESNVEYNGRLAYKVRYIHDQYSRGTMIVSMAMVDTQIHYEEVSISTGWAWYDRWDHGLIGRETNDELTISMDFMGMSQVQHESGTTSMSYDPPMNRIQYPFQVGSSWVLLSEQSSTVSVAGTTDTFTDTLEETCEVMEQVTSPTLPGMSGPFDGSFRISCDGNDHYYSPMAGAIVLDVTDQIFLSSYDVSPAPVDVSWTMPLVASAGTTLSIPVHVEAMGNEIIEDVHLILIRDDVMIGSADLARVGPGEPGTTSFSTSVPMTPGSQVTYKIGVVIGPVPDDPIDVDSLFISRTSKVFIREASAEVVIPYITVDPLPVLGSPSLVNVTLKNIGAEAQQEDAGGYFLSITADDVVIDERSSNDPLDAGDTVEHSTLWVPSSAGPVVIRANLVTGTSIDLGSVTVEVTRPEYYPQISLNQSEDCFSGESCRVFLEVTNMGTEVDVVSVTLPEGPDGWGVTFTSGTVTTHDLGRDHTATIGLDIEPDRSTSAGYHDLEVRIDSLLGSLNWTIPIPILVQVRPSLPVHGDQTEYTVRPDPEEHIALIFPFWVESPYGVESVLNYTVVGYSSETSMNGGWEIDVLGSLTPAGVSVTEPTEGAQVTTETRLVAWGGEREEFYLFVRAPPASDAGRNGSIVTVTVRVQPEGGSPTYHTVDITVGPVLDVPLTMTGSSWMSGGKAMEIDVLLENSGNLPHLPELSVNIDGTDDGISWVDEVPDIWLSPRLEVMEPGQTLEATLTLNISDEQPSGEYWFCARLVGVTSATNGSGRACIPVVIMPLPDATISVSYMGEGRDRSRGDGILLPFEVRVTNTGNVVDIYTVTMVGLDGVDDPDLDISGISPGERRVVEPEFLVSDDMLGSSFRVHFVMESLSSGQVQETPDILITLDVEEGLAVPFVGAPVALVILLVPIVLRRRLHWTSR